CPRRRGHATQSPQSRSTGFPTGATRRVRAVPPISGNGPPARPARLTWPDGGANVENQTGRPVRVAAQGRQLEPGEGATMNRRTVVVLTMLVLGVIAACS